MTCLCTAFQPLTYTCQRSGHRQVRVLCVSTRVPHPVWNSCDLCSAFVEDACTDTVVRHTLDRRHCLCVQCDLLARVIKYSDIIGHLFFISCSCCMWTLFIYTFVQYGHNSSLTTSRGGLVNQITVRPHCIFGAFPPVLSWGQALFDCNLIPQNTF